MNHRPHVLNFSKAISSFLQYRLAEGLSPNTIHGYERDLKFWLERLGTGTSGRSRLPSCWMS